MILVVRNKYPKDLLIDVFNLVYKMPSSKIKKSKGALFTYLVKYYAQNKTAS